MRVSDRVWRRPILRWSVLSVAWFFVHSWPIWAGEILVDPAGRGDFIQLQEAIDAAVHGDVVVVAPGEYVVSHPIDFNRLHDPDDPAGPPAKDITVRSIEGPESTVIRMAAEPADLSRASVMIFEHGESDGSRLEGFTIRDGQGSVIDGHPFEIFGAGILCANGSSPTIVRCRLEFNTAIPGGGAGGGLCCFGSSPVIRDCTFFGNSNFIGGAIACRNNASPTIIDCALTKNWAEEAAGISCADGSSPTIERCTIFENLAFDSYGGGITCRGGSSPVVSNCLIARNTIELGGGGVYCMSSSPIVSDCMISDNVPDGVYCGSGSPIFRRCFITGNQYTGVQVEGATPLFTNCQITGNRDGIESREQGAATLVHCTISQNRDAAISGSRRTEMALHSCILWANGSVYRGDGDPRTLLAISYSLVEAGEVWPGEGNLDDDPLFVSEGVFDFERMVDVEIRDSTRRFPDYSIEDGNYRLQMGSPAIDSGRILGAPSLDLSRALRPCGAGVDMGAYEYGDCQSARGFRRGDCDADGRLDISDPIANLSFQFLGEPRSCLDACDFDDNGSIEMSDPIANLTHQFLGGPRPAMPGQESCGPDPTEDELTCETYGACPADA